MFSTYIILKIVFHLLLVGLIEFLDIKLREMEIGVYILSNNFFKKINVHMYLHTYVI